MKRELDKIQSRLLSPIVEKIRHALVITDENKQVLYVNPAYEQLTGIPITQALGNPPRINQVEREEPEFYRHIWEELERKGIWEGELWDHRADGTAYLKHLSLQAVCDEQGQLLHYFGLFSDLSEQHRSEAELERLTHYDPLTDLPNRILFRNRLGHEFSIANRHNTRTGLVLLNLDRFKLINDAFGFAAGDHLLVEISQRLQSAIRRTDLLARQEKRQERDSDLISRMGGDDFSFILSELRQPDDASVVAQRLQKSLEAPFLIKGEAVYISASMGIAVYPDNATDEDGLLQCAELALGHCKSQGGNTYRFYNDDQNISSAKRVRLEASLRNTLADQGFTLHYQPKQCLQSGKIIGIEALIRWPTPEGYIAPAEFIPLAEDTGLINPLGRWILHQAMADTARLQQLTGQKLQVAINLSARQFQRPGLVEQVETALIETRLDADCVELEITESMVVQQVDEAIETMQRLREIGVRLAIDDFGTGYSSLAYLRDFPVNTLKIDQAFIADLFDEQSNMSIITATIGLGKGLGLKVVAEGIETRLQRELLQKAGCDIGQGFYIGYPVSIDELINLLGSA